MVVNLISRDCQVVLAYADGTNSLDVSAQLLEIEVGNTHLDESGLCVATGTIRLFGQPTIGFTESLDPRRNQARWGRGAQITVSVRNDLGAWVAHPRGALRILQIPQPPGRMGDLEIEVGCEIAFFNVDGNTKTFTIDGFPGGVVTDPERPWIASAGLAAYRNNGVIWCRGDRTLAFQPVDFDREPDYSLDADNDAAEFAHRVGEEVPVERIMTSNFISKIREAIGNPPPIVARATLDDGTTSFNPSEVVITTLTGMNSNAPASATITKQARGIAFPSQFPGSRGLVTVAEEGSQRFYADDENGFLLRVTEINNQARGVAFPVQFPGSAVLLTTRRVDTTYRYRDTSASGEAVEQTTVEVLSITQEPAILVYPDRDVSTNLVPSRTEIQRWKRVNDQWVLIAADIDTKGRRSRVTVTPSSQGNSNPPAPERRPDPEYKEATLETGVIEVRQRIGAGDGKAEAFDMPPGTTTEQAGAIAQQLGKILYSRTLPATWRMPVSSALLTTYAPYQVYSWVDQGATFRYMADGDTFALTVDELSVGFDGLYVGEVVDGFVDPPYRFRPRGIGVTTSSGSGRFKPLEDRFASGVGTTTSSGVGGAKLVIFALGDEFGNILVVEALPPGTLVQASDVTIIAAGSSLG